MLLAENPGVELARQAVEEIRSGKSTIWKWAEYLVDMRSQKAVAAFRELEQCGELSDDEVTELESAKAFHIEQMRHDEGSPLFWEW